MFKNSQSMSLWALSLLWINIICRRNCSNIHVEFSLIISDLFLNALEAVVILYRYCTFLNLSFQKYCLQCPAFVVMEITCSGLKCYLRNNFCFDIHKIYLWNRCTDCCWDNSSKDPGNYSIQFGSCCYLTNIFWYNNNLFGFSESWRKEMLLREIL